MAPVSRTSPLSASQLTLSKNAQANFDPSVHGPSFFEPRGDEHQYFALRTQKVQKYFADAMGVDDFVARVEMELCRHGFSGENSIAVLNVCRDEICNSLKRKIQLVFGEPFNIHGLGGVITCGVTGMGAGLSHCPVAPGAREKYVFFSFPHVAVNAAGEIGHVSRPGRHDSHACGALLKVLAEFKLADSLETSSKEGHELLDPEYSILKQRLERYVAASGKSHKDLNLHTLTVLTEEAITQDLEKLISKSVNTNKADYAVITGILIHNWANKFDDGEPNLEFIQPCTSYTVVNGKKTEINLNDISALSSRMLRLLAGLNGEVSATAVPLLPAPKLVEEAAPTIPTPKPISQPIQPTPAAEPLSQEPVPEPVRQSVPEPAKQSVPEPEKQAVPEPAMQAVPEPVKQSVPEPVKESVPEPVKQSVPPAPQPQTAQSSALRHSSVISDPKAIQQLINSSSTEGDWFGSFTKGLIAFSSLMSMMGSQGGASSVPGIPSIPTVLTQPTQVSTSESSDLLEWAKRGNARGIIFF